ncbi:hypothetical protein [Cohnella fermenti]|uniref:Uncharacterized protein n=1 Tax=Cohnella fermenti TaxID=2565925 RepID=A0A4S4BTQ4_9BACL|nr:hypothetical protein [Cohnella fermenti]THF78456.1 hypothetical protein E6C55_14715 [Cohnella fermenti]
MASTRLDIYYSQIPPNAVYMTFNGLGPGERGLRSIGSGKLVVLKRGKTERNATLLFRENGESFASELEISAKLAAPLGLKAQSRYQVTYDPKTNVLTFVPSPVSTTVAKLMTSAKPAAGRIAIGYELLSKLGIPDSGSPSIDCRTATAAKQLRVRSPSNLFDKGLYLDLPTIRALGLSSGAYVSLTYNQTTKTLSFAPTKSPLPQANRSSKSPRTLKHREGGDLY